VIIQAKILRKKNELEKIPNDRPGWYRWWAKEAEVRALLDSKFITHKYFSELVVRLHKGNEALQDYYYIYTGVAVKESIRARLNWHVNQRHTESTIVNGTLSTLRQTLSSLIAGDQYNESATNDFIDQMLIEYFIVDFPIKSESAKTFLKNNEEAEMKENILILNIMGNNRCEVTNFKKELSKARSCGRGNI
jgi:Uri superfamily endonuclease